MTLIFDFCDFQVNYNCKFNRFTFDHNLIDDQILFSCLNEGKSNCLPAKFNVIDKVLNFYFEFTHPENQNPINRCPIFLRA